MYRADFENLTEWRAVKYKNLEWPYEVSKYGEVRNSKGKILKPYLRGQRKGVYPCIHLCKNGIRVAVDVHRLVAIHFIPNTKNKREVNHLDCNHLNASAINLEWTSRSENEKHKAFMNAHLEFLKVASA